jgi:uncharacterized integral membrane protein
MDLIAFFKNALIALMALAAAGWAVMNREAVAIIFLPYHAAASLPLYMVGLGFLGAGFFLGALIMWLQHLPKDWAARRQKKSLRALTAELEKLQTAQTAAASKDADAKRVIGSQSDQISGFLSEQTPVQKAIQSFWPWHGRGS